MTREEAITQLELLLEYCESMMTSEYPVWRRDCEALQMLIAALRPISREHVEKAWRGEWMFPIFVGQTDANDPRCQCSECGSIETPLARHRFCPHCGAPMMDEAVQMVMEKLEALYD